ncbi:MAG: cardiolipin synthase [Euryarchaeota archaeon]|nr:cardiolipin synthase [Euryarchaeota archaeon]
MLISLDLVRLDLEHYAYILILLADLLVIIYMVFIERRHPSYIIPWILIIAFLPVIGFILYLVFGFHYFREKQFRPKSEEDRILLHRFMDRHGRIEEDDARKEEASISLSRVITKGGGSPIMMADQVRVFNDGKEKFKALFEAIKRAEHHVHLEYYILRNDRLGSELIDLLTIKSKEGVKVRLLLDGMGNHMPMDRFEELKQSGGNVSIFFKPLIPLLTLRFNYHDHRKIAVIDGHVGFVGGFNIGVEYMGEGPFGEWRDYAVELVGDAVKALQIRFILDWNYASREKLNPKDADLFPFIEDVGDIPIQIISSGPDSARTPIKDEYLKLINIARRYVYIQTPYFIPDESIMDALRIASLSGVDVRIMFPDKPDHPLVYWASLSFIGQLLSYGVKAYTFDNGFIHAKTAFVDDAISSIGSANWDIRSFRLNFETNGIVYDEELTKHNRELFEKDLERCTEITLDAYRDRNLAIRVREGIARLFAPIL